MFLPCYWRTHSPSSYAFKELWSLLISWKLTLNALCFKHCMVLCVAWVWDLCIDNACLIQGSMSNVTNNWNQHNKHFKLHYVPNQGWRWRMPNPTHNYGCVQGSPLYMIFVYDLYNREFIGQYVLTDIYSNTFWTTSYFFTCKNFSSLTGGFSLLPCMQFNFSTNIRGPNHKWSWVLTR